MMTTQELATIERVDLREIWPNEATDFTPWLAENLSALGEALGLDLELQSQEAAVGGYSLDIFAHDGNGRPVVIENQLGPTDHSHLGQLLTYAAGFDANVTVWIAKEFRDEHRETLDLLNHRTDERTDFFGVEVELWRIGDSRPAVNFNVVSSPNEWRKRTVTNRGAARDGVSERRERYQHFFQGLIDTLREEHRFTNARRGQPQNWHSFSAGRTGFSYGASFNADRQVRVEFYIDPGEQERNKRTFDQLEELRELFESELGEGLLWDRLDNRRASRISVRRPGSIDDDQETLDEIRDWMIERLLAFKKVFGPRLTELA